MSEERTRTRRVLGHPLTHFLAALLILGLTQAFVVKMFVVPSGSMERTLEVDDRLLMNRLAYSLPGDDGVPDAGDVVIFHTREDLWPGGGTPPPSSFLDWVKHGAKWVLGDLIGIGPTTDHLLVKRVIGAPGQTVKCCSADGRLTIDGQPLEEPYVFEDLPFEPGSLDCSTTPRSARCFPPVTIPGGKLLVMGDHRSASGDGIAPCRGSADAADGCVRWVRVDDVLGEALVGVWPISRAGGVR